LSAALLVGLVLSPLPAAAHVTIGVKEVKAGEVATFVLKIPHGCAGAATTGLRVSVPPVLSDVVPEEKAGWTATVAPGAAASSKGEAGLVAWTGGSIPAEEHATFTFRATVSADARGRVYVPIVQQCGTASERWIEIPKSTSAGEPGKPAPAFDVKP
jgi:uncharacterized protein YcnI